MGIKAIKNRIKIMRDTLDSIEKDVLMSGQMATAIKMTLIILILLILFVGCEQSEQQKQGDFKEIGCTRDNSQK